MTETDWEREISQRIRLDRGDTRTATSFHGRYGSRQSPHRFYCDDGQLWVAKGHGFAREAAVEIIVASLGQALGAPVPSFAKLVVSDFVVKRDRDLRAAKYPAGTWFGSLFVDGIKDLAADQKKTSCLFADVRANRKRYALLAALWGWTGNQGDQQLIFDTHDPNLVHSVDHGFCFPGSHDWTAASVTADTTRASLDGWIGSQVNFTPAELRLAAERFLVLPRTEVIATAVARPLDSWNVTMHDRVALARYLSRRGDELATDFQRL